MHDDYDIHAIWRIVGSNWRSMEEHAPEGYEPVTRVHLPGSPEAIPVGRVETHRRYGLVMLFVITPGHEGIGVNPNERFVFVDHSHVGHVEITYERKRGRTIGFSVTEGEVEDAGVGVA